MKLKFAAVALAFASSLAAAQNANQGVSSAEITLGTIQDLSGPIAAYGKAVRNGMQLRFEELNEQGGLNGRKVRLLVEDSAYDPKKAVLAGQKLISQDKVFAIVGHMGSAHNLALLPLQLEKNIINFYPINAAREMYDPPHRLKWAYFAPYFDQMRIASMRMVKDHNLKKPCVIYQDDEYGLEVTRGAEAGLKTLGMQLAEKTSFKRGATDFSSQVARMKAAGCDLVIMGTIIRETVGAISEARKTGFNPVFIVSAGAYTDLIPKLGGKAMDGLYATMTAQHPYLDESSQPLRFWANKYKTRFGEDPSVLSTYGYLAADTFILAAQKAGPNLTTDGFVAAMNTLTVPRDIFGSPEANFSAARHLASPYARLSQLQDGRWKVVSDYVGFNGLKTVTGKDGRLKVVSEFFND